MIRWLLPTLADRCEALRAAVTQRDLAGDVVREAATYRPGSINNRDLSARGMAIYYATLRHCLAHLEAKQEEEMSAVLLLAALIDSPAPVLSGLTHVYPKSIEALAFMAPLWDRLSVCEQKTRQLIADNSLELLPDAAFRSAVEAVSSIEEPEREELYRLSGWCATYSSPALPFSDVTAVPKPPAWLGYLGLDRLQEIAWTFYFHHNDRAQFLTSLMSVPGRETPILAAESGSDLEWVTALSEQLETPAETLKRDWSLTQLLAIQAVAQDVYSEPSGGGSGPRMIATALFDAETRSQNSLLN